MILRSIAVSIVAIFLMASTAFAQSTQPSAEQARDPEYWFHQAVERMQQKDDAGAIEPLKKVLELMPDQPTALQNLGQAYQNIGKWSESNDAFARLLKIEPENWRAQAKLVQNYQALGKTEDRDRERDKILAMNKAGQIDQKHYVREQFTEGKDRVLVLEYFELAGDRAVRYSFHIVDSGTGKTKYRISLGSYDSTNEISRELGELKEGERLFHLDGYYPDEHRTFAMFKGEPTYEDTRKLVVAAIHGELKASSSSTATTKGVDVKVNVGK